MSSLRPEATGKQNATGTLLTIDGIEPFSDARTICKGMPSLQIKQIFKLIQDNQSRLISSVQYIQKRHCLVLKGQVCEIW